MDDNRRRHRRVAMRLPATVVVGAQRYATRGFVMDLSEGGTLLMLSEQLAVGPHAYVTFRVEPDTYCEATGQVIRVMPFGHELGLGIEFAITNACFENFIRNLAAAREAERADFLADIRDLKIEVG